jgi:hypothetical protein
MTGIALSTAVTLPTGLTVGLEQPFVLLALPLAVALAWGLVARGQGSASPRSRRLLLLSRLAVVVLVVTAVAGPYTTATRVTDGDPRVTMLVDRSDSMAVSNDVAERLATAVEDRGVPVERAVVGDGTQSRVGDGIAANLEENGSLLVVSDGRVTGGRSLAEVAERAQSLNATVSVVRTSPSRTERYVTLHGPSKTSQGVESAFMARVSGVEATGETTLTVSVDGEQVASRTVDGTGNVEFTHAFESVGVHRIRASIESADEFPENDVFYKTVRVVEKPKLLYVSPGSYPFREYLSSLYDVETASSVPSNLDPYYAVVLQDTPAARVGNVDALQRFVIDGNGLLVVGGDNAFENGGYEDSPLASALPVSVGESTGGSSNLVLVVDVSGSATAGMRVQKAIALDVLDQLGDENTVGIVGFNQNAYRVAELGPLSENRGRLEDRIRRLEASGGTNIDAGLQGAAELLGEDPGSIILISDGRDTLGAPAATAAALGERGVQVVTVAAGRAPKEQTLQAIARESGGTFLRATESSRLRLLFGGSSRRFQGSGLTIVDPNAFVTSGVTLTANPSAANDVSVKRGAEFLVATSDGTPAVASWRFGLGRVVTITAFGSDGSLDGLLERPDSLLLTKATNYAIGDPERKASGVAEAVDTRVGEPTRVTVRGDQRPEAADATFREVAPGRYQAEVTPTEPGFHTVLGATYAANYPVEYGGFGPDPALEAMVDGTGGRTFGPGEAAEIASFTRQQATRTRTVRDDWTVPLLLVALLVYLLELLTRRWQVYRGRTRAESGLP